MQHIDQEKYEKSTVLMWLDQCTLTHFNADRTGHTGSNV